MKIQSFRAGSPIDERNLFELTFGRPNNYSKNNFSILIGPNGTRKSRTLRDIIDLSLLKSRNDGLSNEGKVGKLNLWRPSKSSEVPTITKILAISGVATDRFPSRLSGRRIRSIPLTYAYVGPRSENNLVSRVHSINQIARSLLEQAHLLDQRRDNIRHSFKLLHLFGRVSFTLRPSDSYAHGAWTPEEIEKRFLSAQSNSLIERGETDSAIFKRCIEILKRPRTYIRLDLDHRNCIRTTPASAEVMKILMVSGALSVSEGTVETLKGEILNLSDFSSGQWQLLSSLLFAAAVVEDDSLILIDEPENSLHPAWQQQYLPLIRSTISCATGVHVVVATHSPLVAASLDPEEAEVISLRVERGGRIRSRKLKADPFGWTADAILEEVFGLHSARSVDFTSQMDGALGLMAKGDRKNAQLVKLVNSLSKIRETLPEDDVAREIIGSMVAVVLGSSR